MLDLTPVLLIHFLLFFDNLVGEGRLSERRKRRLSRLKDSIGLASRHDSLIDPTGHVANTVNGFPTVAASGLGACIQLIHHCGPNNVCDITCE